MITHAKAIEFILSVSASHFLAFLAFFLVMLYVLDLFFIDRGFKLTRRREGLIVRAINWVIFGFVFLLFGKVIPLKDLDTWRAAARIALLFLMMSEMAFELTTMWPEIKRILWNRETLP